MTEEASYSAGRWMFYSSSQSPNDGVRTGPQLFVNDISVQEQTGVVFIVGYVQLDVLNNTLSAPTFYYESPGSDERQQWTIPLQDEPGTVEMFIAMFSEERGVEFIISGGDSVGSDEYDTASDRLMSVSVSNKQIKPDQVVTGSGTKLEVTEKWMVYVAGKTGPYPVSLMNTDGSLEELGWCSELWTSCGFVGAIEVVRHTDFDATTNEISAEFSVANWEWWHLTPDSASDAQDIWNKVAIQTLSGQEELVFVGGMYNKSASFATYSLDGDLSTFRNSSAAYTEVLALDVSESGNLAFAVTIHGLTLSNYVQTENIFFDGCIDEDGIPLTCSDSVVPDSSLLVEGAFSTACEEVNCRGDIAVLRYDHQLRHEGSCVIRSIHGDLITDLVFVEDNLIGVGGYVQLATSVDVDLRTYTLSFYDHNSNETALQEVELRYIESFIALLDLTKGGCSWADVKTARNDDYNFLFSLDLMPDNSLLVGGFFWNSVNLKNVMDLGECASAETMCSVNLELTGVKMDAYVGILDVSTEDGEHALSWRWAGTVHGNEIVQASTAAHRPIEYNWHDCSCIDCPSCSFGITCKCTEKVNSRPGLEDSFYVGLVYETDVEIFFGNDDVMLDVSANPAPFPKNFLLTWGEPPACAVFHNYTYDAETQDFPSFKGTQSIVVNIFVENPAMSPGSYALYDFYVPMYRVISEEEVDETPTFTLSTTTAVSTATAAPTPTPTDPSVRYVEDGSVEVLAGDGTSLNAQLVPFEAGKRVQLLISGEDVRPLIEAKSAEVTVAWTVCDSLLGNSFPAEVTVIMLDPNDGCAVPTVRDEESGLCVECPDGTTYVQREDGSVCEACPAGYHEDQDTCAECPQGKYQPNNGTLECYTCPANTITQKGAKEVEQCSCETEYYTKYNMPGVECTPCIFGAVCHGGTQPPWSEDNYFAIFEVIELEDGFTVGDPAQEGTVNVLEEYDYRFFQCDYGVCFAPYDPDEPNSGPCDDSTVPCSFNATDLNKCRDGHTGRKCASCNSGYWKLGSHCRECSMGDSFNFSYFVTAVVILCWLPLIRWLTMNFQSLFLCITFFQIMALIGSYNIPWPETVRVFLSSLTFVNFNVSLSQFECYWQDAGFMFVLTGYSVVPFIFVAYSLVSSSLVWLYSRCMWSLLEYWRIQNPRLHDKFYSTTIGFLMQPRSPEELTQFFYEQISFALYVLYLIYIGCITTALKVFICTDYNRAGDAFMDDAPEEDCSGERYETMMHVSSWCLVVYLFVVPMLFITGLFYFGRGGNRENNETYRLIFGFFYLRFEPHVFWYELVILVKKLGFVLFRSFMQRDRELQAIVSLLFLSILLVIQFSFQPFDKDRYDVLECTLQVILFLMTATGLLYHLGEGKDDVWYNPEVGSSFIIVPILWFIAFVAMLGTLIVDIDEFRHKKPKSRPTVYDFLRAPNQPQRAASNRFAGPIVRTTLPGSTSGGSGINLPEKGAPSSPSLKSNQHSSSILVPPPRGDDEQLKSPRRSNARPSKAKAPPKYDFNDPAPLAPTGGKMSKTVFV